MILPRNLSVLLFPQDLVTKDNYFSRQDRSEKAKVEVFINGQQLHREWLIIIKTFIYNQYFSKFKKANSLPPSKREAEAVEAASSTTHGHLNQRKHRNDHRRSEWNRRSDCESLPHTRLPSPHRRQKTRKHPINHLPPWPIEMRFLPMRCHRWTFCFGTLHRNHGKVL